MNPNEVTREDLNKIKQSLKDPKFNEILEDYMLEVSDPKNRKEHNDYLLQLQEKKELPEDQKIIKPRKYFCIQSSIASETDYNFTQTLYINVSIHDDIDECKIAERTQRGNQWRLPYSVGKLIYDQDKTEDDQRPKVVSVIDVVFNPNIVQYCTMSKEFKNMVCNVAFQGVQKKFAEKKEKVDQDFRIVSEFDCKGKFPAFMPIKTSLEQNKKQPLEKPKIYHDIMKMKDDHEKIKENINEIEEINGDGFEEDSNIVSKLVQCVGMLIYVIKGR